jgi:hypothetical protein
MDTASCATPECGSAPCNSRRPWFRWLSGLALLASGPALLYAHLKGEQLWVPWYIPILGTLGLALLVRGWLLRRTIVGGCVVSCGVAWVALEWFVLAFGTATPDYVGPMEVGAPVPLFSVRSAAGDVFTQRDLAGPSWSMLVFFRGRW